MRHLFAVLFIFLLAAACSSSENDASSNEVTDFCANGFHYTVAGEDFCILEKRSGNDQNNPTCPDDFTAHIYSLDESETTPAAPAVEHVVICTQQDTVPEKLATVLQTVLNRQAPSQVNNCQLTDQSIANLCGACDCTACDADEKACTHMQCDLSTCEADQLCQDRQCIPNPEAQGLTCDNVIERWRKFSNRYMDCETSADCTIFNIPNSCDESMAFDHSGDVINLEGARFAAAFFAVYQSDECAEVRERNRTYDAGPANTIYCRNNRCGSEQQHCNLGPEGD